jgi:hypothetical protein
MKPWSFDCLSVARSAFNLAFIGFGFEAGM